MYLKRLEQKDATEEYVMWMNDCSVTRYLESHGSFTLNDIKEYINTMSNDNNWLLGIFVDNDIHIGNVKIGSINWRHRFADVGIIIGRKDLWGKGHGTLAISLANKFALKDLELHSLWAGIISLNIPSYKAFIKAGYNLVGKYQKRRLHNGVYCDELLVEKIL